MTVLRFDEVERRLRNAKDDAIEEVAYDILERSNKRVPIEDHELHDSGKVTMEGDTAVISYNTPYAVAQHQIVRKYSHLKGQSAKFLEKAGSRYMVRKLFVEAMRRRIFGA